jgi:flagellar biogenesis protein FliO
MNNDNIIALALLAIPGLIILLSWLVSKLPNPENTPPTPHK